LKRCVDDGCAFAQRSRRQNAGDLERQNLETGLHPQRVALRHSELARGLRAQVDDVRRERRDRRVRGRCERGLQIASTKRVEP
jgi:hypothetical protein